MYLKLNFPQETITTAIIISDFSFTEVYYNDLSPAENSIRLTIQFNTNIANLLKININNNIKAEIINTDESNYFVGYIKKNVSFSKATINGNISIEIVSPSALLAQQLESEEWKTQITLTNAISYLLEKCGIVDYNLSNLPSVVLPVFHYEQEEQIKQIITELLFEYGFCFDFDNDGIFICNPLFNQPPEEIENIFIDGSNGNIIGNVAQILQERRFDGVSAEFRKLVQKNNQLIFKDESDHVVAANGYLYDNESGTFTNYDCTVGEPFYIQSINNWKVGNPSYSISMASPENAQFKGTFENKGIKGLLTVKNKLITDQTINNVEVYGSGYFFPEEAEKAISADGKNTEEITLDYIFDSSHAAELASNLRNYYKYSFMKVTLKSYSDFNYGSFVLVSVGGMGTIKGRIIQKKKTLESLLIEYTIEAIAEFEPAEIKRETSASSNNGAAIKEEITEEITPIIEDIVAPVVVSKIPRYRGTVETLPDNRDLYNLGDWVFLKTATETEEIGLYKNEETGWSLILYTADGSNDSYFASAAKDCLSYANTSEEIGSYALAYISKLFTNKIVVTGSIESDNFSEDNNTGFLLDAETGNIIANNGIFRGQVATDENLGYFVPNTGGKYIKTITIRNTNSEKKMYNYKFYIYAPNNIQSNNERSLLLADLIVNFSTQGQDRKSAIISGIIYDNNTIITTTYTADKYCTITFYGRAGDSLYLTKILLKG